MIDREMKTTINNWILQGKEAFLLTGARQIGKTWLIRDEIEKSGYTKFEVNFIDQPDMVSYLNAEMSAEDFLIKLKMIMPEDCKSHETVVFFDEIQKCPEIVTKIKFLVDEGSVVKVAEDLYTRKHFMEEAREIVEGMLREREIITIAELRDALNTSRKSAKPIMEYMDSIKVTKRNGTESERVAYV